MGSNVKTDMSDEEEMQLRVIKIRGLVWGSLAVSTDEPAGQWEMNGMMGGEADQILC